MSDPERPIYRTNREKARLLLAEADQKRSEAAAMLPWWKHPAVINAAKTIAVAILLALLSLLGYEQASVDPRLDAARDDGILRVREAHLGGGRDSFDQHRFHPRLRLAGLPAVPVQPRSREDPGG